MPEMLTQPQESLWKALRQRELDTGKGMTLREVCIHLVCSASGATILLDEIERRRWISWEQDGKVLRTKVLYPSAVYLERLEAMELKEYNDEAESFIGCYLSLRPEVQAQVDWRLRVILHEPVEPIPNTEQLPEVAAVSPASPA